MGRGGEGVGVWSCREVIGRRSTIEEERRERRGGWRDATPLDALE
jgi:hypothetical protein